MTAVVLRFLVGVVVFGQEAQALTHNKIREIGISFPLKRVPILYLDTKADVFALLEHILPFGFSQPSAYRHVDNERLTVWIKSGRFRTNKVICLSCEINERERQQLNPTLIANFVSCSQTYILDRQLDSWDWIGIG